MIRLVLTALALATLSGCATPVDEIGVPPKLSEVGSGLGARGASVYSYPEAPRPPRKFSLWNDRQSRFFTDPRALSVGDVLTVRISIDDRARFKNESERKRTADRGLGFDFDWEWDGAQTGGSMDADINSNTETKGEGATTRSEKIDLLVAAVVTGVLPNGNLIIKGSQEVRVNAELRILTIAGIVRPQDIEGSNIISYERIAEARISYGGRGRLTEVQQPPYGQQILDNVLPF
jgi:flagellar L-ring protein FlgH